MPIPSLPLEIVVEIASHLRAPPQGDTKEAIESGRAVSLVCRRWYPIGQELRWKDLKVDIVAIPSLLAHFDLYPHLPRLVASLVQTAIEVDHEAESDGEGFDAFPKLLDRLQKLRFLDLVHVHSAFQSVLRAASTLPDLTKLHVLATLDLNWKNNLSSIFNVGFRSLQEFDFTSTKDLVSEDQDISTIAPRQLKSVRNLTLGWWNAEASNSVQGFLSILNPAVLLRVSLAGTPACASAYEWLAYCPSLCHLRIAILGPSLNSNLPTLLQNLSKSKSLQYVEYKILGVPEGSVYLSPVTLDVLFASLPSTLIRLPARELYFADSNESQDRIPLKPIVEDDLCTVEGMVPTEEGVSCAFLWKKRGDEKGGKGYRYVLNADHWAQVDDMLGA